MNKTASACNDFFTVNPLDDPIVRSTLKEIHMTGKDLMNITVKDLNRRLIGFSHATVGRLKKCRRTLKNRGYAKNCRIKRLCLRNELEKANKRLIAEINELKRRNRSLDLQLQELRAGEHQLSVKQEPDYGSLPLQSALDGHTNEHFSNISSQQGYTDFHEQQPFHYQLQQQQQEQQLFYKGGGNHNYDQHTGQCVYLEHCHDELSDASQVSSSPSVLCNSLDGNSSPRQNPLHDSYQMLAQAAPSRRLDFSQANQMHNSEMNDYRFS